MIGHCTLAQYVIYIGIDCGSSFIGRARDGYFPDSVALLCAWRGENRRDVVVILLLARAHAQVGISEGYRLLVLLCWFVC
jgi:hypothetical protein